MSRETTATTRARRRPGDTIDDPWKFLVIDAALAALFVFRIAIPGPVVLPLSDVAALVLIGLAAWRKPKRSLLSTSWYVYLMTLLLVYLIVVALVNDIDPFRRLIRFAILAVLAAFIASQRIDLKSIMIGVGVGLVVNTALFYAGIAPDDYDGVLTGFLQDKNRAGLYFAVIPLLMLVVVRPMWARIVILVLGAGGVYLTDSRTSMAAYIAGLLWVLLSGRIGGWLRVLLGLGLFAAFNWAEDNLAEVGQFADRSGSDLLRSRIDAAAEIKVSQAPWYGMGVGEGEVTVAGNQWLFHNSYLVLLVEGGWVMLVCVISMFAVAGFGVGMRSGVVRTTEVVALEATTIAILLCALRLGEVFFTLPAFMMVGIGLLMLGQELDSESMADMSRRGARARRLAAR